RTTSTFETNVLPIFMTQTGTRCFLSSYPKHSNSITLSSPSFASAPKTTCLTHRECVVIVPSSVLSVVVPSHFFSLCSPSRVIPQKYDFSIPFITYKTNKL
ncbi:unnamed protein product, partial [Meganyctiphanes norvegica]